MLRSKRKRNTAQAGGLRLLFAAALACWLACAPVALAADDADDAAELTQEELNDLGESNLVNLQQVPDNSFMYDMSIYDLVNADTSYQGATVQVTGEVVGDAIASTEDEGCYWITLNSLEDENEGSLSVLVDEAVLSLIDTYGSYGKTGTTLFVNGTFYVSCASHEGIMDIHADSVSVAEAGSEDPDELVFGDLLPGLGLCALGLGIYLLYRLMAEDER